MKYKMVAIDIDGTLLNSEGKVPKMHKKGIQMAQEKGVYVVLATARYYMQAKDIMDELNYKGILVSNDGAVSIEQTTKKILHDNSFSINDVAHFINACRKNNVQFSVITAFDYFVESISEDHKRNCEEYCVDYTLCEDVLNISERVMKFAIMDTTKVGGWQHITPSEKLRLRIDGDFWKEYLCKKATKTNSLKEIANNLNIAPSEIIAIGDQFNDIDMIEYAGMGIAMGNAPDNVKEIADDVTLSNDDDGVYHAINKYFLD
ncbi:Cof-type HAD-IIB family hydrolase [Salipaludibacillus sp. HK11]|uniref:Cof-type HAD-IIB family hydrolase n=1 Tax=Salipaludibacillus sp. HK11 TaxID=3394320 RepID=UPI0039FD3CD1